MATEASGEDSETSTANPSERARPEKIFNAKFFRKLCQLLTTPTEEAVAQLKQIHDTVSKISNSHDLFECDVDLRW